MKKQKKKAWTIFSIYIRRKYADSNGYVRCVTCGAIKHWKQGMQAGHFIDSRNNSVLFDERLVHPQCVGCNMFKRGNKVKYTLFMLKKYTQDEIEGFFALKYKIKKMTKADYEEIEKTYKRKVEELDNGF